MIRRVVSLLLFILPLLSSLAQTECERMLEAADTYFKQGKYEAAAKQYRLVQSNCQKDFGGVSKKLDKCQEYLNDIADYKRCTDIESCESYLSKHPNGRYVSQVRKRYNELMEQAELARQIAIEDSIYQECTTEDRCEVYLNRYPNGRYVSEVYEKKNRFAEIRRETEAYNKCTTIAGCDEYLTKYPNGRYYSNVVTMKKNMEQKEREAARTAYMKIRKVEFGNFDADNDPIDNYGSTLYASEIKYLKARITYDGILDESKEVQIFCKVKKPDGSLSTGQDSPAGYSFSNSILVEPGTDNKVYLSGWGSSSGGTYVSGNYRLELWYNGNRIDVTTVTIKEKENELSRGNWRDALQRCMDYVTQSYENGVYKGMLSNGSRDGMGLYLWGDGDCHVGGYSYGIRNGTGIYLCKSGYVRYCPECVYYVGGYDSNNKSGKGTCYDKYGNLIYYGEFQNDKPTGTYPMSGYTRYKFECISYSSGSYYVGETMDGKRHGMGIIIWADGDMWYGSWNDGKRDGYGVYIPYNGTPYDGRWNGDTKM